MTESSFCFHCHSVDHSVVRKQCWLCICTSYGLSSREGCKAETPGKEKEVRFFFFIGTYGTYFKVKGEFKLLENNYKNWSWANMQSLVFLALTNGFMKS